MQRNVDTRISNDDDLTLYICDSPEANCFNCVGCSCLEAHTEDECVGNELGCGTCRKIDHFVVEDIEEELDELFPVVILDEMPKEPIPWDGWSKKLLACAAESLVFKKFSSNLKNNFVDSQNKSKTISFRRYGPDVFQQSEKSNDHMIDALLYGMGIQGHSLTGVFYDEAAEIPEGKITGKNPHSETN